MNEAKRVPWSDCQLVAVETDEGTVDAVTLLEALLRLPSEHGSGRPELAEGEAVLPPTKPKTKLISTYCGAIIEVPDDDEPVPEFVPQIPE